MQLKLLQLNIWYGKYFEEIVSFVKKQDFDILHFQEVSGGLFSDRKNDLFTALKETLGYNGFQAKTWNVTGEPASYEGNATLFKQSLRLENEEVIYLKPYTEISDHENRNIGMDPRCAIVTTFSTNGQKLTTINTHLTVGPDSEDEPFKVEQGKILYEYMKTVPTPFILSGDFNVNPRSQIVRWIDTLARNLTTENKVTNTLNPKIHRASHLFPPGIVVDYIYVSHDIKVKKFFVVQDEKARFSDHLGLVVTCEL